MATRLTPDGPARQGAAPSAPSAVAAPAPSPRATPEPAPPAVLIVGAGPTGLTLACDLARRGVPARVVERSATLFPGSRGKGLQPRTLEVFDDLGIGPAIARAGGPYPRMLHWRGRQRLAEWDLLEEATPHEGAPYHRAWMLPQWRTQEVLYERLCALGGSVEFNTSVRGLAQDAHGVTATVTPAGGPSQAIRAQYLVAADGGRSTVRRLTGVAMRGEVVDPSPILVADVRLQPPPYEEDAALGGEAAEAMAIDRDHWHVWAEAAGGRAALCPLRGTDTFQFLAQYEDVDARPDTTPEAVRRLLAERTSLPPSALAEVLWASTFRPRAALAERFRVGRVLLAGDAAHVHSPAGGQGLNTSVQDAYNLGWKLEQIWRHGAHDALLDTYEEERLPIAAQVLGLSTRLHRTDLLDGTTGVRQSTETQQLGVSYGTSSLAVDRRPPHAARPDRGELAAGDRAPNARCVDAAGRQFTLFDAFRGPHFTLLDFRAAASADDEDGQGPDIAPTQERTPPTTQEPAGPGPAGPDPAGPDPAGPGPAATHGCAVPTAAEALGVSPDTLRRVGIRRASPYAQRAYGKALYLIRPDGYIGLITHDPAHVAEYFALIRRQGRAPFPRSASPRQMAVSSTPADR